MKISRFLAGLVFSILSLSSLPAHASINRISVQLIAEDFRPNSGATIKLAIRMTPAHGWHGYWVNPGDSGMPPEVSWDTSNGALFGPLRYPVPITKEMAGFISYIYEGSFTLLTSVQIPKNLEPGSVFPLRAQMKWLACSDAMCLPEKTDLALDLVVGAQSETSARSAQFASYEDALPRPYNAIGVMRSVPTGLELAIKAPPGLNATSARLFPVTGNIFPASTIPIARMDGQTLVFLIPKSGISVPSDFQAVIDAGRGSRAYMINAKATVLEASPSADAKIASSADHPSDDGLSPVTLAKQRDQNNTLPLSTKPLQDQAPVARDNAILASSWLISFLGAITGGLLLNLMPCVFPILSLKALSLARSGASEKSARIEGLAYTAGAIIVATGLGVALVALRAAGTEIGWAFQLQNPSVVLLLSGLMTLIGLNLLGAFELPSVSVNGALMNRKGSAGAFMTGALAAFIATPCAGPFMGVALGAALVLPAPAAVAVFAGLGLGLALPFLAIGLIPALRSKLPKPGLWMVKLRQVLSFPMFLTGAALLWVLSQQTGTDGLRVGGLFLLGTTAALIWLGIKQRGSKLTRAPLVVLGLLASAAVLSLPKAPEPVSYKVATSGSVRPFNEATLAELRAKNVPVFVDFTADWCLTCKVNEKVAINAAATQEAFKKAGVVTLIGDWTNADPSISAFLAKNGRNSIPFYLYYGPQGEALILPQILTPGLLAETVE